MIKMRIRNRYYFKKDDYNKNLFKFMDKNKIEYDYDDIFHSVVLEVFIDEPYWNELESLFEKQNINPTLVEKVYTQNELDNFEWFELRSSYRLGYPQPEEDFRHITYNNDNFCNKCGSGLIQKDSFYINKLPKFKSRNFFQPFWIEDELFASNKVVEKFMEEDITGIEFIEVKKYRKNETIENVMQLKVNTILPKGLIVNYDDYEKEINCSKCGTNKYILKGSTVLKFKRNLFNDVPDFVKTFEQFGEGWICTRNIIVSKRVYDVINANKLGRGLIFEPIELV